jgi:hypothetical protein
MNRSLTIINQLLKIRVLELQLRGSLTARSRNAAELRSHLAELKSRVEVLDRTLDQSGCERGRRYATAAVPAGEGTWGY